MELAKSNFTKSPALNPKNQNAKTWLKRLGSLKPGQALPSFHKPSRQSMGRLAPVCQCN
jgi:hypothetical protein